MRSLLVLLLPAMLASALSASAQSEARLVISRPLVGESLVGAIDVAVIPQNVDDSQVLSLQIVLDGRTVAELGEPPWRVTIDAGPELTAKRLDVVARLADGGILRAGRTYEPAPVMQEVDVRLVSLSVSVTDRRGRPVAGLKQGDFEVFDGKRPVAIERFSAFPESLAIALVIDGSGSMTGERLEAARSAAREFIRKLGKNDRLAVVRFADDVRTLSPFSTDRESAGTALGELSAEGGTALHDALVHTAKLMDDTPPGTRRAIILLSDGRDESSSGLEPGSFHTLQEAIKKAHLADAEIFSLGIGAQLDLETDFADKLTTAQVLERIALSTGGRFERVRKVRRLGKLFEEILEELRAQYSLAYTPEAPRPGETWRPIEVRVRREGARARTREGYFAR